MKRMCSRTRSIISAVFLIVLVMTGCAHYPVNQPLSQYDPADGYRETFRGVPGNSDELLLYLTFSGGGTRAAAFSYGVLEELRRTEVTIQGKKRRLLDEVDVISSVSGGSFTSGYYGLYGERIFEDFEQKFLRKNIQGILFADMMFNPYNWVRLLSPYFGRSDLAAEYYDNHVFDHGTFQDILARKGPMININSTDMVEGIRLSFNQDSFDILCSDVSKFPVARAAAASSAVPMVLTPVTLSNYAGTCGFTLPEHLKTAIEEGSQFSARYQLASHITHYLDATQTPYIHLVDGGVSDNLGIWAVFVRNAALGGIWGALKATHTENAHKVAFIVVDAEKEVPRGMYLSAKPPGFGSMLDSYSSIGIERTNLDAIRMLYESFGRWKEEIQQKRCGDNPVSTEPGACGDITFYLILVQFNALRDESEQHYLKTLPTSFKLSDEQVDRLRDAAHWILSDSQEFQQFLHDLK
jgi:NTE family protein